MESLDEGHVYSDSSVQLNCFASLESGLRLGPLLEVFVGAGWLWTTPRRQIALEPTGATLPTTNPTTIDAPRGGAIFHAGLGAEF